MYVLTLRQLAARALVGREGELADPARVPAECAEFQAAYTAAHCPHCWRAARALPPDPRWPRCRFGHSVTVTSEAEAAKAGHVDCLENAYGLYAAAAAQWGHLTTLQYVHRTALLWDPDTPTGAANSNCCIL